MKGHEKNDKEPKAGQPVEEESLEQLIEKRKTRADAYRKMLDSLQKKLRKDK